MRRAWLGVLFVLGACFDPTTQNGVTSANGSSTGDSTAGTAASSSGASEPSSTSNDATSNPDSTGGESTTADPTTVADSSSSSGASSSGSDSSSTGSACPDDAPCQVDADCPGGTCVDCACVDATPDYGPCGACGADELEATIQDVDGCYCAPPCTDNPRCPAGATGTAMGACAVGGGGAMMFCALLCTPGGVGECPDAMTCVQVGQMVGVGVCTYP